MASLDKEKNFITKLLLNLKNKILTSKEQITVGDSDGIIATIDNLGEITKEYFPCWMDVDYIGNIYANESPFIPSIIPVGMVITFDKHNRIIDCYTSIDVYKFLQSFTPNIHEKAYSYNYELPEFLCDKINK